MNSLAKGYAKNMVSLRLKFDRSVEIDQLKRKAAAFEMATNLGSTGLAFPTSPSGSATPQGLTQDGFVNLLGMEKIKGEANSDTFVKIESGMGEGWGKTVVTVTADLEEAVAYFWDFTSRNLIQTSRDHERIVTQRKGNWEFSVRRTQQIESKRGGFRTKVFHNTVKIRKLDDDTIIFNFEPDHHDASEVTSKKRAEERTSIRLTRMGDKGAKSASTKVEYVTRLLLGATVSNAATKLCIRKKLANATEAERHFNNLIPLGSMTRKAGEFLGADMMGSPFVLKKR